MGSDLFMNPPRDTDVEHYARKAHEATEGLKMLRAELARVERERDAANAECDVLRIALIGKRGRTESCRECSDVGEITETQVVTRPCPKCCATAPPKPLPRRTAPAPKKPRKRR